MPHYDYDKDYPFAAFITNLGKYNEGALVGEWVKFPTTAEELKKVFERIGIGAIGDDEIFTIDEQVRPGRIRRVVDRHRECVLRLFPK